MTIISSTVAVGTLGGTITMTSSDKLAGIESTLGAEELLEAVPGLKDMSLDIWHKTIANVASGSLSFDLLFTALAWAKQQVERGAQGIVLVQGTDTLEETSYFLDLYWPYAVPLVLTGAMRHPEVAGADGASNLLNAIKVAVDIRSRGHGVFVVMNDEVHQARYVMKTHANAVNAFESPQVGPIGVILENQFILRRQANERLLFPVPEDTSPCVLLLESTLNESEEIYDWILHSSYKGLVIAGFGAGHVPGNIAKKLVPIIENMPVMICTRTGRGSTTYKTYAYEGSEIDLQRKGALMGGFICPRKARLLLTAMLWSKMDKTKIAEHLRNYSKDSN